MNFKRAYIFLLMLMLTNLVKSQNSVDNGLRYFISFIGEDNVSGVYRIRDTIEHVTIDSSRFDNKLNASFRDSLTRFVSYGNRMITNSEKLYWIQHTWFLGKRVKHYYQGGTGISFYKIVESTLGSGQFENVRYGYDRTYHGDYITYEAYYSELGMLGLESFYYPNGRLQYFRSFNYVDSLGFTVIDGPSLYFYPNGKLKNFTFYESGYSIINIDYNIFGTKKWSRRNRIARKTYNEYLKKHTTNL